MSLTHTPEKIYEFIKNWDMEPTEYMIKLITTLFEPFEWLVKEHGIINVSWHVFVNSLSLRDVNLDYEDEEVMNMIVAQSLNKIKNISDEEFGLNIQENQEIFFTEPDQLFIKSCQITISMIIFSYLEYHDQCFFFTSLQFIVNLLKIYRIQYVFNSLDMQNLE